MTRKKKKAVEQPKEETVVELDYVEPEPPTPGSTMDGPRYCVGLATVEQPNCYKHVFETESKKEAEEKAVELAEQHGRETIINDRKEHDLYFRYKPKATESKEQEDKDVSTSAAKRGRKPAKKPPTATPATTGRPKPKWGR